jgi:hypothetical protein
MFRNDHRCWYGDGLNDELETYLNNKLDLFI